GSADRPGGPLGQPGRGAELGGHRGHHRRGGAAVRHEGHHTAPAGRRRRHGTKLTYPAAVPAGSQPAGTRPGGGTLAADKLTVPVLGKLAAVVHKEAARTSELVRLPRDHPERELLVRQVSTRKLKRFGNVVRVKVDGAR